MCPPPRHAEARNCVHVGDPSSVVAKIGPPNSNLYDVSVVAVSLYMLWFEKNSEVLLSLRLWFGELRASQRHWTLPLMQQLDRDAIPLHIDFAICFLKVQLPDTPFDLKVAKFSLKLRIKAA
eukprot:SAG31_NODE_1297_length_8934_cov_26.567176_6_plen_122_part_00